MNFDDEGSFFVVHVNKQKKKLYRLATAIHKTYVNQYCDRWLLCTLEEVGEDNQEKENQ